MSHRSQQNTTLNDFLENLLRSSQSKSTFTRLEEDETVIRITTLPPSQWWCTQDISYASFTTHLHLQERKIEQKNVHCIFCTNVRQIDEKIDVKIIMSGGTGIFHQLINLKPLCMTFKVILFVYVCFQYSKEWGQEFETLTIGIWLEDNIVSLSSTCLNG